MEYLLVISSFIITITALFGDTYKPQNTGINKLNSKGKISFFIAVIVMTITIYTKYDNDLKKDELKFSAYELVSIHAWELEQQIEKVEQMNVDENKLLYLKQKMQLLSKQLTRVMQTYSKLFEVEEINLIQELVLIIENETLKLNTQSLNSEIETTLTDLIFKSRETRKKFCNEIIEESSFCYERQIVSGVDFWDSENDIKMNEAIKKARESFNDVLKNIKKIKPNELFIKFPIPLNDGTNEHVWLINTTYEDGFLSGIVGNFITGDTFIKQGDLLKEIYPEFITDWRVSQDGVEYGNFTLYVNLERYSEKEKKDYLSKLNFVLPIEPKLYQPK